MTAITASVIAISKRITIVKELFFLYFFSKSGILRGVDEGIHKTKTSTY